MIKTNFLGGEIPKESLHSLYNYWFCYENGKKELSTSLFRTIKYKSKKIKMAKVINTELESESGSELGSDAELVSKPELESDSE